MAALRLGGGGGASCQKCARSASGAGREHARGEMVEVGAIKIHPSSPLLPLLPLTLSSLSPRDSVRAVRPPRLHLRICGVWNWSSAPQTSTSGTRAFQRAGMSSGTPNVGVSHELAWLRRVGGRPRDPSRARSMFRSSAAPRVRRGGRAGEVGWHPPALGRAGRRRETTPWRRAGGRRRTGRHSRRGRGRRGRGMEGGGGGGVARAGVVRRGVGVGDPADGAQRARSWRPSAGVCSESAAGAGSGRGRGSRDGTSWPCRSRSAAAVRNQHEWSMSQPWRRTTRARLPSGAGWDGRYLLPRQRNQIRVFVGGGLGRRARRARIARTHQRLSRGGMNRSIRSTARARARGGEPPPTVAGTGTGHVVRCVGDSSRQSTDTSLVYTRPINEGKTLLQDMVINLI